MTTDDHINKIYNIAEKSKDLYEFTEKDCPYPYILKNLCPFFKEFSFKYNKKDKLQILKDIIHDWIIFYTITRKGFQAGKDLDFHWRNIKDKKQMATELVNYLLDFPLEQSVYVGIPNPLKIEIKEVILNEKYSLVGTSIDLNKRNELLTYGYGITYQYTGDISNKGVKHGNNLAIKGVHRGFLKSPVESYRIEQELNKVLIVAYLLDILDIHYSTSPQIRNLYFQDRRTNLNSKLLDPDTSALIGNISLVLSTKDSIDHLLRFSGKEIEIKGDIQKKLQMVADYNQNKFDLVLGNKNPNNEDNLQMFNNLISILSQILGTTKGNIKYILLISLIENLVRINAGFSKEDHLNWKTVTLSFCNILGKTFSEKVAIRQALGNIYKTRKDLVHQAEFDKPLTEDFYVVLMSCKKVMNKVFNLIELSNAKAK